MKTAILILIASALAAGAEKPIHGFLAGRLASQHALEAKARAIPEPLRAGRYLDRMAAEPHHAGSPGSRAVAEYALGLFREWGLEARIEEFEALLPYPTSRRLEMTAPVKYRARLIEPAMPGDADSRDKDQLPTYNAYSATGDVTAPLVYVNYGIPADYARLREMGIDVKGKIVIARYGQSWRGTKAKTAQENGAAACIIYSDPRDDGFFQGDPYPLGPWRPEHSVQRGSVMDMPVYVGDPLSPGWASEKGSKRLNRGEAETIMKIPVLPISEADALPLLRQLTGPVAPVEWRGALPLTYHVGPGPATVRLAVDFDWSTRPVYNVVARVPGAELPDEWVIYGNHHDAWVNGAADPVSGAIALLETARTVAELRKSGWKPRRTLIFALWDAEEFGLIGSTEWVEKHKDELTRKAVAYLNTDMNAGGTLGVDGSFLLEQFFREVMRDTVDPKSGKSLLALAEAPVRNKPVTFQMKPPGAGSDYVAFIHHLGIPSLNVAFREQGGAGTYHSIYDSAAWFRKHMDGEFVYAKALAQVMTTAMLRLGEADTHPFEFTALPRAVREAAAELAEKWKVDVTPLQDAFRSLDQAAARYAAAYARLEQPAARLNRQLAAMEKKLLAEEGLPGRQWYRHRIHAPGLYTGYSAKMLPGIREAVEAGRAQEAATQTKELARTLQAMSEAIEKATTLIGE